MALEPKPKSDRPQNDQKSGQPEVEGVDEGDPVEEIRKDKGDWDHQFDPLEAQAEALPAGIKGSEGTRTHVFDIGDGNTVATTDDDPIHDDDTLGGQVGDPSKLTAD